MNLGIIIENGKAVSHRSLFKILVNPFLRMVGLQVASDVDLNVFNGYVLTRCKRAWYPKFAWTFPTKGTVIPTHRLI